MRKILIPILMLASALLFTACQTEADVASRNLSTAADNFEVQRRIVFYNGITDTYMLEIIGFCSLGNGDKPGQRTVTCKMEDGSYKKHFLGISDNVTYFVEQIDPLSVSGDNYRVIFRPQTIIPNPDLD